MTGTGARRERRAAAITVTAVLAVMAPLACRKPGVEVPAGAATYEMRGRLERPVDPDRTLWIRHETVPDFRDERGEVVGMESMMMPFTAADGLDLAGLAPGDAIAFTLAVSWTAERRPIQIVAWKRLPPGTQLAFDAPPAGNGTPR